MTASAKKALRFTALHLQNWRNFKHVEVELQRRVFLVGPNASGKSNLLDVFRFLHDVVSVGGGFQDAVGKRGGTRSIRSLAARADPDVTVRVRVGTDDHPNAWEYELRFGELKNGGPILKGERVSSSGSELMARPDPDDEKDPERLTQTALEQVYTNREFRELVEFLKSVKYMHLVPQLIREPDRSVGRQDDPFGGDFLEQIAHVPKQTRGQRLRRIEKALRVAVPQLRDFEFHRDPKTGEPHLRGKYEHWRKPGAWQYEHQLSDGTLRLLGLLWATLDGAGPLLLEEPELSLHTEVVRYLPQMFARLQGQNGRQVLFSTHSPELLEDEGIALDEVLLLQPGPDGTVVDRARDHDDVSGAVEGVVDEAVLRRIVEQLGAQLGVVYGKRGKAGLDASLSGYNRAARLSPWVVLRDLDRDECAPAVRSRLLPDPAPHMCFPEVAATHSDSLNRCIQRVRALLQSVS
ncbi:MAG: ATP-binding protein [Thermoleophilia bacterium]